MASVVPAGHPGDLAWRLPVWRTLVKSGLVAPEQLEQANALAKQGGFFVSHLSACFCYESLQFVRYCSYFPFSHRWKYVVGEFVRYELLLVCARTHLGSWHCVFCHAFIFYEGGVQQEIYPVFLRTQIRIIPA